MPEDHSAFGDIDEFVIVIYIDEQPLKIAMFTNIAN